MAAPASRPAAASATVAIVDFIFAPPWCQFASVSTTRTGTVPCRCRPSVDVGLHLSGGTGGSAVQAVFRLDLQLAIEGKKLEEVRPGLLPPAARRLAPERHRLARFDRVPGELRSFAGRLLLQPDRVGVLWLGHEIELPRRLLREYAAMDDESVLGVEAARALVVVHRADVDPAAVEHQQLRMQAVMTVAREFGRLPGAARVLRVCADLVELHPGLEQRLAIVHVTRLRGET